jgi:hypothetical protein
MLHASAAFQVVPPRPVHQDAPHHLRGDSKKMCPILPLHALVTHQPRICFLYGRGARVSCGGGPRGAVRRRRWASAGPAHSDLHRSRYAAVRLRWWRGWTSILAGSTRERSMKVRPFNNGFPRFEGKPIQGCANLSAQVCVDRLTGSPTRFGWKFRHHDRAPGEARVGHIQSLLRCQISP